ncbi:hypothetical protein NHL50_15745 [Acidimicrobiia bacterium EGI L10123]|uniref:hypothetical protein n=1 Tax=Salinilacustrithrix flava TaxID=2957203 RepID=UPI003D7C27DF|nr:hypothetical protein [Acidimicrobiia bacterium EGI L10123]
MTPTTDTDRTIAEKKDTSMTNTETTPDIDIDERADRNPRPDWEEELSAWERMYRPTLSRRGSFAYPKNLVDPEKWAKFTMTPEWVSIASKGYDSAVKLDQVLGRYGADNAEGWWVSQENLTISLRGWRHDKLSKNLAFLVAIGRLVVVPDKKANRAATYYLSDMPVSNEAMRTAAHCIVTDDVWSDEKDWSGCRLACHTITAEAVDEAIAAGGPNSMRSQWPECFAEWAFDSSVTVTEVEDDDRFEPLF